MILRTLVACSLLAFASTASAAKLASICYALDKTDGKLTIRGDQQDQRLPIASVSKVMTAWWGLAEKGPQYRFRTKFHVTPADEKTVDIHIEGSRDPYFGKESLHMALSELHTKGVRKVRKLTFDENFKFYWNVTSGDVAIGHYDLISPRPTTVLRQLRVHGSMLHGYEATRKAAKARGFEMATKPDISVETIEHRPLADYSVQTETQTYAMASAPLQALLKEMNRNSNNHAANQIFEHLGGASAFHAFSKNRLNMSEDDMRFVNGSGDRLDIAEVGTYNEASCSSVIRVLRDLRHILKSEKLDLKDVMAVAGVDVSSTTHRLYNNDTTTKALIGKTGTVNPDVTLAGIAHTKDGDLYFMINMATKGTRKDWNSARQMIRTEITKLVREFDGGKPISVKSVQFYSFDEESVFLEDDNEEITDTSEPAEAQETLP